MALTKVEADGINLQIFWRTATDAAGNMGLSVVLRLVHFQ